MADLSMFLPRTVSRLSSKSACENPFILEKGSILFCDVAGFTPLTESLSAMGKEGAEKLTFILNTYFTEMIKIVDDSGGDVIRFGGDAMTIFFKEGMESRAVKASHLMMERMESFRDMKAGVAEYALAMKIGAAKGKVLFGIIGNSEVGMDYYAAGPPLDHSAEAEHQAASGMIVLHPTFGSVFSGEVVPLDGGFLRSVKGYGPITVISSSAKEDERIESKERVSRLVPRHIVERAGEGTLGEHRGTTVIFLGFEGPVPGDDLRSAKIFHEGINRFFIHVATSAKNYGGIVNKVDMGDKGMKAIILFGSPYALENREEMALRCALEIRDRNPLAHAFRLKVGVTSSPLFTGPVGSPMRREFTVMGDGINTAARLMQKAPLGEIYCDSNTAEAAKGSVVFRTLEPLALKGKERPVSAFSPEGISGRDGITELPLMVEREYHLDKIKRLLMESSGPLLLVGDAGTGKTSLIEWARRESMILGLTTTRVFLAPYHRTRPYSLWRGAIRSVMGAKKGDPSERLRLIRDKGMEGESLACGVLLNPMIGLEAEDNETVRSLNPKERKELTFAVAERLLQRGGERLILADNLEYADPLSLELLSFLLTGGENLSFRMMASCRVVSPELERDSPHFEMLDVPALTGAGMGKHLSDNLKLDAVSENLLDWFRSKTGGNPKLMAAMVRILKEKGILIRDQDRWRVDEDRLFSTPFPEKLEDLYLGKIDELPREEREIVQAASVLGYSVSLFLLSLVIGKTVNEAGKLAEKLSRAGVFVADSWSERPYFRFSDNLLRDAVYNSLPFSLKRDAHMKCARFLEAESEGKPGLYPSIAGHFKGAGDQKKAGEYSRKSAFDALSRFDNLTAMRFLEDVCGRVSEENLECAFSLVEVYGNLGRASEEVALIERLEQFEGSLDLKDRLRLLSFETKKAIMERNFAKAESLFRTSEEAASKIGDSVALSKIYVNMAGGLYGPKGELDKAQTLLEKCLALPETGESAVFKVTALFNSANIMKHRGENEKALATYRRAHNKASRLKLLPQIANISGAIANLLYAGSDYRKALAWSRRARKWSEALSLRQLMLFNDYIQAMVEYSLGDPEMAAGRLRRNCENAKRLNNHYVAAISFQALIDTESLLLEVNKAIECGKAALDISRKTKASLTFRYSLIEMLKLFESVGAREEAFSFLKEGGYESFLSDSQASSSVDPLLESYLAWSKASSAGFSRAVMDELSPDLKLDYLILHLGEAMELGRRGDFERLVSEAEGFIRHEVSYSFKIRLSYLSAKSGTEAFGRSGIESKISGGKHPPGIYGLRRMAIGWRGETAAGARNRVRRAVIAGLYKLKAAAPQWVFQKMISFGEIRDLLRGTP